MLEFWPARRILFTFRVESDLVADGRELRRGRLNTSFVRTSRMIAAAVLLLSITLSTALQLPTTPPNPRKLRHAPPTAIFSDGGIDRTVTSADQDWSWTGMIEGEGDYEQDWGDAEAPEGSAPESRSSRRARRPTSSRRGRPGAIEEVEALLDSWQEALAIADDGSDAAAANPEALMASWRALIASREAALRGDRRADLRNATIDQVGWVPAYLTGWASVDNSLPKKRRGGNAKKDDGDDVEAAAARVVEREKEFRREDDDFTFEWQKFAEKNRAAAARARRQSARSRWPSPPSSPTASANSSPRRRRRRRRRRRQGRRRDEDARWASISAPPTARSRCSSTETSPRVLPTKRQHSNLPPSSHFSTRTAPPPRARRRRSAPAARQPGRARRRRRRSPDDRQRLDVRVVQRLIGRTASADELQALAALDVPVRIGGAREVVLPCPALRTAISPVDVAAELISAMKQSASKALAPLGGRFAAADGDVRSAVVTVPAYFDASQRAATETACHLAGLDDVFLLREPEAAALARPRPRRRRAGVIFDLGGGTFDVSIVDVGGVSANAASATTTTATTTTATTTTTTTTATTSSTTGVTEVIATSGDPRLGGNDWDRAIANWLEQQFVAEHGVRISAVRPAAAVGCGGGGEGGAVRGDVGRGRGGGPRRHQGAVAHALASEDGGDHAAAPAQAGRADARGRRWRDWVTPQTPHLTRHIPLQVASMARVDWPTEIGTLDKGRRLQGRTDSWRQQVAWRWQDGAKVAEEGLRGTQRFPPARSQSSALCSSAARRGCPRSAASSAASPG